MSWARVFSIRAVCEAALLCLTLVLSSLPTMAQSTDSNYILILASGFLCDSSDSSTCPATTKSSLGDTYELSGAGTFDTQNKSVKAAGTFTHKAPNGNVLETGVWLASELVSFASYGAAPNARPRQGMGFGPRPWGPRRTPLNRGAMPTGGLAVFQIRLLPLRAPSRGALLQVNCALGELPPQRSVEGIRLRLDKNGTEFSEEVSGRVMFLLSPSEVGAPIKAPRREAAPTSPEAPGN